MIMNHTSNFILISLSLSQVYATADNSSHAVIQHETRVNKADFVGSEGNLVSVAEDKALRMFNPQGEMVSLAGDMFF
jgi:hypothetical protein